MENIELMPDLPKAFLVFTSDQMSAYAKQYAAFIQAQLEAARAEVERLRDAAEAVLTNEDHAVSCGARSYQKYSDTWLAYKNLRDAFTSTSRAEQ